ncbi:MAG TPA: GNAT family N-acetyltransferase [Kofleriaceae bacterium]|nr:GNAT family N-acetyltransferase [Kofleriaceae bacterium]
MQIRRATREDGSAVVELIRCLAEFESLPPPDAEAEARLLRDAFDRAPPRLEVWVAVDHDDDGDGDGDGDRDGDRAITGTGTASGRRERVIAYAACFECYSTFRARPTLFLEDLFVHPSARRRGVASRMLALLRDEALRRGCGRFEWFVLAWNEDAKSLYRAVGAEIIPDWQLCRVDLQP